MEFAVTYLDQYNNHKTINTTMYISMIYAFYNMKTINTKQQNYCKKQHCHWIEKEEKMSTIVLLFEKKKLNNRYQFTVEYWMNLFRVQCLHII